MTVLSLRNRLILIILLPLIVISMLAGYWRYTVAERTAEDLYDRSLVAIALAISRDVAVSDGDALSAVTRDLMRDAAEGDVFYHVHGPDGVYVTGYATPPVLPAEIGARQESPLLFSAVYRGENVRAVQLREPASLGPMTGFATVTVWQTLDNREALAGALAGRTAIVIGILILTVAGVVWLGVDLGLRPLIDLEAAISQRGSNDLRAIKRPLPQELSGLVRTLNSLFDRVRRSMASKDIFISDAAHQMRNPVAGVLSMAQSLQAAPGAADRDDRVEDLVTAARHASRLTTQLLSYERARADSLQETRTEFDLVQVTRQTVDRLAPQVLRRGIELEFDGGEDAVPVLGDEVLTGEAVDNLIDNALQHGGPTLSRIAVSLHRADGEVELAVCDDGQGIPRENHKRALARFAQIGAGHGSGLGLPIAASVARALGGTLELKEANPGLCVVLHVPLEDLSDAP